MTRKLSLAAFSLVHLAPAEAVRTAAAAGFEYVGVRLAALPSSIDHHMLGRSRARQDTSRALADTGLSVLDVEAVWLTGQTSVPSLEPLFEAAAELGARYLDVLCFDPSFDRACDTFGELCRAAGPYGLGCSVEFMGFSTVPTIASARTMVDRAGSPGAGVLVDPLHLFRTGGTVADLAATPPGALPVVQLCDAASAASEPDLAAARAEAVAGRMPPGEGVFPLREFVRALPHHSAISVEVPYVEGRGELAHATRLHDGGSRLLGG